MQLGEDDIREFTEIWQEEFQEEIPRDEARARASQVMELYALLAGLPTSRPEQSSASPSGSGKP